MGETESSCLSGRQSGRDLLLRALHAVAREDYSIRLPSGLDGLDEELVLAFNAVAEAGERVSIQARNPAVHDPAALLANVAQELRAPLGVMLTLSRLLAENDERNLSAKQVDYAQTIYSSGTDLMSLIDNIVDLVRIGSGSLPVHVESIGFGELRERLLAAFRDDSGGRGRGLEIELAPGLPDAIQTDSGCLQQILRGLLLTAFKSPRRKRITLRIAPAIARDGNPGACVTFSVADDGGIGDAAAGGEAQPGLLVCRELAQCLGGDIAVHGAAGSGFVLCLPVSFGAESGAPGSPGRRPTRPAGGREATGEHGVGLPHRRQAYYGRRSRSSDAGAVLIADCDPRLAAVMLGMVRGDGYQAAMVTDSEALEARLKDFKPDAIILGEHLRDIDGWSLLRKLRLSPSTHLLPVALVNVGLRLNRSLQIAGLPGMAVFDNLPLPSRVLAQLGVAAGRRVRRLLLAAPPGADVSGYVAVLAADGIETTVLCSIDEVLAALQRQVFDGAILAPSLGGMDAVELLRRLTVAEVPVDLPVALLDPALLVADEGDEGGVEIALLRHRDRFDMVLEDTAVFLERTIGNLSHPRAGGPEGRRDLSAELAGVNVLIVDRNVRSLYALTGTLEQQGMRVTCAQDGLEGVDLLRAASDIDIVIVSIASPGPEGADLLRLLRGQEGSDGPPIIAVIPRGTQAERGVFIDAGASDCLSRPVNTEHLLSLLRVLNVRKG